MASGGEAASETTTGSVELAEGDFHHATAFLVYSSPDVAHIIPRRAFTPEGLARVSALLSTHVKRRPQRSGNKVVLAWFVAFLALGVIWQFLTASSRTMP
jgi:hypothetical protein